MRQRLAAAGFLVGGGLYLVAALSYPLGTTARPGAGLFPAAIGVLVCAVAAVGLLAGRGGGPGISWGPGEAGEGAAARVASTSVGLVGFCLLLPWIGYAAAALLLVGFLLRRLGGLGWIASAAIAAVVALASWYVFGRLLGVPLPGGALLDR